METPRDRNGSFEPQIVKKNQTKLSEEIDDKIISLFALGMSYRDIQSHIADIYGPAVSDGTITNRLLPELKKWQPSIECRLSLCLVGRRPLQNQIGATNGRFCRRISVILKRYANRFTHYIKDTFLTNCFISFVNGIPFTKRFG